MRSSNYDDFILRDIERDIAHHERSLAKKQPQPQKPPAPRPSAHFLSQLPSKPLTWLWPGSPTRCATSISKQAVRERDKQKS